MAAARRPRPRALAAGAVHPARRTRILLVGFFVVLSLFAAQLVRLQGLDAGSVSAAALGERLSTRTIPAARGTITDVHGADLAVSVERKRVIADPTLVVDYQVRAEGQVVDEGFSAVAAAVSEATGVDQATVLERLTNPGSPQYAVLVPDASPLQWQELHALDIPGLAAEDRMRRDYPLGEAAAPLVGWLGAGDSPSGGFELMNNEALTGTPGRAVFEAGRLGEVITTGLYEEDPAVPGQDLRLSIDADLQWYVYDAVRTRVGEAGALSGYGAVMDARTGELLALASYPSFDPAQGTQDSTELRNAAIEDVYEPGSTSKLITAAAALEEGIVDDVDTPIEIPTGLPRAGTTFRDVEQKPVQQLTFAGVLARSSNMGTILYGEQLSDDQLYGWKRAFGIGEVTGVGLPGESPGLVPDPSQWSGTTRYTYMFGQGLASTMLQQLGVFQAVANDGVRVPPSLVAGSLDGEGRYQEAPAREGERVISEETAHTLTEVLQEVPSTGGTAPLAAVPGYHVAGKTSTASRVDPETGRYSGVTSSFMGYAPADDPRYVVGVVVQAPTRISEYGGVIAGPVFSDIMRHALQKEGVPPATDPPVEVPLEYDPEDPAPGEEPGVTLDDIALKDERTGG